MEKDKIKLLTFYSDTHKELYETFFLESYNKYLTNSFELNAKYIEQISKTGNFGEDGFEETMFKKIEHIIDNIDINDNKPIVFADCDVHFFGDFKEDIIKELGDYDIKFQNDILCICAGFFISKQNKETLNFFNEVLDIMKNNIVNGKLKSNISDQIIINHLISNKKYGKIGLLPSNKYFTVASSNHGMKQWNGEEFNVPKEVIMHHGNWTVGIDNKFSIMNYVKNKIENDNK